MRFFSSTSMASSVRYAALLVLSACALAAVGARPALGQVDVQIRDVSGSVGESIAIPVEVNGLDGRAVTAYEFALPFDPSVVEVTGVSTDGTITPSAPTVNVTADTIKVSFSAAEPLAGDGVLLEIDAQLAAEARATLDIQSFQFFDQDGNEVASTTDAGIVTNAPLVDVQVPDVEGKAGDAVTLSLTTDSLDGRDVTAYEFALPFDPSVIDITGVSTDGTVTPTAPTVNVMADTIKVSFSAAEPLGGDGPLLKLQATLAGVGTNRLDFRSLSLFDQEGREVGASSRAGLVQSAPRLTGRVPDTTVQAGTSGTLPLRIDGLDGADVTAYEFTLPFDSSVVDVTGVDVSDTATPSAPTVNVTGEEVRVSFSSAEALSGDGPLLRLQTDFVGGGSAVLAPSEVQFFNSDAEPVAAALESGIVTVEGATDGVQVQVANVDGDVGQSITVPIRTDSLDGKDVTSYQFTLPFDPSVIDVTGVSINGTLTPSAPVTNLSDDTVRVSFSSAEPLTGAGTLLELQGQLVGGGEDVLSFSNFQFFDTQAAEVPTTLAAGRVTAQPPSTASSTTVRDDGTVSFGETGASISFSGVSGSGEVTVRKFTGAPTDTTGIREGSVSGSRYVISTSGDLSIGAGTEARFDVAGLEALDNPSAAVVYRRENVGTGTFAALPTRLDATTGELVASLPSFSEFAFASDTTPPDPPTGLSAAAAEEQVALDWNSNDEADLSRYRIYRDTTPIDSSAGTSGLSPLDSTTAGETTYVDTSGMVGEKYYYRVTAVDTAANESEFSESATGVPLDGTPPDVPEGLAAASAPDSVSLAWTGSDAADVDRYRIYRDTTAIDSSAGPADRTPLDSTQAGVTSFVDTSGMVGQKYYYRVTAVDTAANESGFSGSATGVPLDGTPPDVPEGLAAASAPDSVSLAWTGSDAADVDRYRIYRDTTAIDSSAGPADRTPLDITQAGGTSFTDTSVAVGQEYYYRVTAVDTAANESGFSNEARATPTRVTPPSIVVSPQSVSDTLALGDSTARTIQVQNTASGEVVSDLTFEVQVAPERAGPVEWLSATPVEGRVASGEAQAVTVKTRAVSTPPGTYDAVVRITSNDPDRVSLDVPVSLTIERPPISLSNPQELPSPGTEASVRLNLPPAVTPLSGTFFYGRAGQRAFQDTTRDLTGVEEGGAVSFSVPGTVVEREGVRYYATVRGLLPGGRDSVAFTVPATAPGNTAFLPVRAPSQVRARGAFEGQTYRMLTIPFDLGDRTVYDVLRNEYGAPDPGTWRVARWNPEASSYAFGESATSEIAPGEAFWVITETGDTLTVEGSGQSVDAAGARSVTLQSGWNQIGSPFLFPVAWSDVQRPSSVRPPVLYDASRADGDRYRFEAGTLRPWRGAFVFNEADTSVTIQVPPLRAGNGSAASGAPLAKSSTAGDAYRLQATAIHHRDGHALKDEATWLGFDETAEDGFGPRDRAKPPAVGPHVRLHATPDDGPALARSLKPSTAEGAVWNLRVGLRLDDPIRTPKTVSIVLDEQGTRPSGFRRYVVDRDQERRLPVTHQSVSVRLTEDQPTRRLRVIVGTESFARENDAGASLTVDKTKLRANAPNPFTESTTIPYQLAEETDVTIAVYDLLGRRVHTLVDETQRAGMHRVEWRPGQGERALASGVYFCRMTAGSYQATRKITLVR